MPSLGQKAGTPDQGPHPTHLPVLHWISMAKFVLWHHLFPDINSMTTLQANGFFLLSPLSSLLSLLGSRHAEVGAPGRYCMSFIECHAVYRLWWIGYRTPYRTGQVRRISNVTLFIGSGESDIVQNKRRTSASVIREYLSHPSNIACVSSFSAVGTETRGRRGSHHPITV